jgi:hypothetical protein
MVSTLSVSTRHGISPVLRALELATLFSEIKVILCMRRISFLWILLAIFASGCRPQKKIVLLHDSVSAERLSVYRGLIEGFSKVPIRGVANRTIPFDFAGFPEGRPCLRGIDLENVEDALRSSHPLEDDIVSGTNLKVIEMTGLDQSVRWLHLDASPRPTGEENETLVLSEIVFDKQHHFAVLKYLLTCGKHCVSGGALVMQKADDKWIFSDRRPCSMIVGE